MLKDSVAISTKLKKAISNEMFFEATMLECMILEIKIDYILKEASENVVGFPLDSKIRKINMLYISRNDVVQKILDRNILNKLELWNDKRIRLLQNLTTNEYDMERFRNIAVEGNSLVDYFMQKN